MSRIVTYCGKACGVFFTTLVAPVLVTLAVRVVTEDGLLLSRPVQKPSQHQEAAVLLVPSAPLLLPLNPAESAPVPEALASPLAVLPVPSGVPLPAPPVAPIAPVVVTTPVAPVYVTTLRVPMDAAPTLPVPTARIIPVVVQGTGWTEEEALLDARRAALAHVLVARSIL